MSTHRLFAAIYDFAGEARLFLKGAHQRLSTRWLTSCSLLCLADLQDALGDEQWRAYVDQSLVRKNEAPPLDVCVPSARWSFFVH